MKNVARVERDSVKFGDTTIEYSIARSRRRKKTIEIKLEPDGGVRVTAPVRAKREELRQVVLKRADWIICKASEVVLQPPRKELVDGESVPYLGNEVRLSVETDGVRWVRVVFDQASLQITVPCHLDGEERRTAVESAIVKWYRSRAAEHLGRITEEWALLYGCTPARVLVRAQRRLWGSCSSDGTIRFNWRLILAPPSLIDYVVVHELVHLRVRNHSATFWTEVARLIPDYKSRRALLREVGPQLAIQ